MNKLVSKNPVQRFKQGKKIVKAQFGNIIQIDSENDIWQDKSTGKKYQRNWRGRRWNRTPQGTSSNDFGNYFQEYSPSVPQQRIGMNGKPIIDTVSPPQNTNNNLNTKDYIPVGGVQAMRQKYLGKSNMDVAKEETHNYLEGLRNKYSRPFQKNSSVKTITPVDNYYLKGFENRKDEIAKLGGVRAVQKMLGFTAGNGLDGKWGQNTEDAYQEYLKSQSPNNIKYTPGIQNNGGFTPTGETTTNFNVAKEYLTPKQETPTFNLGTYVGDPTRTYNVGNIRANRGNLYSNVNEYWDYLSNNKNSDDFQLFQNIMGTQDGNLNREAFDAAMAKYGISGNLGRRDSGRLANLLNDLRAIGTEGSDARNAFLNSYKQSFDNVQTGAGNTIYDRSATREWLRNNAGGSAYSFTGDQRKAVRNILNGQGTDQDKELIKGNADLTKALTGYFKIGGTMNILPSRNIVERFKQGRKITFAQNGVSFKDAWNQARANKQRYFNWNGRMYNSKAAGNDTEYESFVDNMNEMSALLPTDRQPKHLGWERNNPTSSEVRGNDRETKKDGTENTLTEIIVSGKKRSKKSTPSAKIVTNKNKNKATRNMSGTWGQGSGGGQQYADQRQYAFERSAFDKMRTSSSSIFGSTAYKTDNRGRRYVERDGSLYYDDGTYYNPQTRKTGKYTYTPGGLFSRNLFTQY